MASVWKHPLSPFWTLVFCDESGHTRRRTSKQRRKSAALLMAQNLEDLGRQARERKLSRREFDDEVARMRERLYGERNLKTTREFFTTWLMAKKSANANSSVHRYTPPIERFLNFLGPRADQPLREVAIADCHAYRDHARALKLAPATLVVELKTLRSVFSDARRQQFISFNPAEAVELPRRIEQVKRKVFTPEQVEIILREAGEASEWYTLTLFGLYTAMRLGDAKSRSWGDVDFEQHVLTYRQCKTGQQLTVPLHSLLEEHLLRIAGDRGGLICPELANRPVGGRNGLSQKFIALMRRAGLETASIATGGQRKLATLSFHSLRKSFNSWLRNQGVSQEDRKSLTGHKSDAVNDRYTETKLATLRAAVKKLPKLEKINGRQMDLDFVKKPSGAIGA